MADPIDHGVSRTLPLPPLGGRVPPYMRPLRSPRPTPLALTGLPSTTVRTARLPHWGRGHQSRPSHSIFPASTGLPPPRCALRALPHWGRGHQSRPSHSVFPALTGLPPTKMRTARPPPLGEGSPIRGALIISSQPFLSGPAHHWRVLRAPHPPSPTGGGVTILGRPIYIQLTWQTRFPLASPQGLLIRGRPGNLPPPPTGHPRGDYLPAFVASRAERRGGA